MSEIWPLVRGRVYAADIGGVDGRKFFLVVSNNARNTNLPQALAVRLTTTRKPQMPSIVRLSSGEPFSGSVVCDDIIELYPDEVRQDLGALSPTAMRHVNEGLRVALGL